MNTYLVLFLALISTAASAQIGVTIKTPDIDAAAERLMRVLPQAIGQIDPLGITKLLENNSTLELKATALEREVIRLNALQLSLTNLIAEVKCDSDTGESARVVAELVSPYTGQTLRNFLNSRCTADWLSINISEFQGPPGVYILRVSSSFPVNSPSFGVETRVRSTAGGPPICMKENSSRRPMRPTQFNFQHECDVAIRAPRF